MEIKKYNYNCNGGNSGSGQKISQPSFSGYDARKLTGIFVTDKTCAQALKKLCDTTQLDVFVPNIASKSIRKEQSKLIEENKFLWAQDYLTFLNYQTKAVLFDNTREFLKRVLRATGDGIKKDLNINIEYFAIAGYSLAGLLAIYSTYRTEIFTKIASASGSFWFPKFVDFAKENNISSNINKMYFSLGNKESKVKNQVLATVEKNTIDLEKIYKNKGIQTIYEVNEGNHFQDAVLRMARGIKWILE